MKKQKSLFSEVVERIEQQFALTPEQFSGSLDTDGGLYVLWIPNEPAKGAKVVYSRHKDTFAAYVGWRLGCEQESYDIYLTPVALFTPRWTADYRRLKKICRSLRERTSEKSHDEALRKIEETFSEITDQHLLGGSTNEKD